jgi:DNA-binding transcriptional LysR family regulator
MQNHGDLPSLDLLRGFEAAARHLSFTRAAEELHLTQSAMSRQVKALEEALGTALFQRRHRALLLTEAGQSLHRTVADVLRTLREATAKLAAGGPDRSIAVATTISFASLWLVPRLRALQAAQPDVDVRVSAKNALVDLDRERIDLAIRYCTRERAGAAALRLFGERIVPVASPALVPKPLAAPSDLARHPLLHYEDLDYDFPWMSWETWFETFGVTPPAARGLRLSNYEQIVQAAIDGEGIALGRVPLVTGWIRSGRLRPVLGPKYATAASKRAFWLVVAERSRHRPEVARFSAWVQGEARRK